jgi:hypothetical protein
MAAGSFFGELIGAALRSWTLQRREGSVRCGQPPPIAQLEIRGFDSLGAVVSPGRAKPVQVRQVKQGMMQELLTGRIRLV